MLAALVAAALRTLLLAGAVRVFLWLFGVRDPRRLLTCWTAVLAASLAMPLLQQILVLPRPVAAAPPAWNSGALNDIMPPATAPPAADAPPIAGLGARAIWPDLYLAGAAAMLLRLALGLLLAGRLLRRARPLTLDAVRPLRVRVGPGVGGPVTLGSTVLLPADCAAWPDERLRATVAHEAAHARAGDYYLLLLSRLGRAIFWFSPLAWWLHRELIFLTEMASDDAAIALLGGDRVQYARVLLDVARQPTGLSVGVAMARPATVERRIERVLRQVEPAARTGVVERVLLVLGVLCLAAVAAVSVGRQPALHHRPAISQPPPYRPVALSREILARDAGYYRDPENGSLMIVTLDGDHLETHRAGLPPVPEYPYSARDFFLTTVPQQNTFVTGPSGDVVRVVHHQDGTDELLDRIGAQSGRDEAASVERLFAAERAPHAEQPIDPALLANDVGRYAFGPGLTVAISRNGQALDFQLTGRPAHVFLPYGEQDFFSTHAAAQISFLPGPNGKARALVLHEGGRDRVADRIGSADGMK